jgi:hypothetical protein
VQKEVRWAHESRRNIITIFEDDFRKKQAHFDYGKATEKYKGTEWARLLEYDSVVYRRDTFEADAMVRRGVWARVIIGQFRQPSLSTFKEAQRARPLIC